MSFSSPTLVPCIPSAAHEHHLRCANRCAHRCRRLDGYVPIWCHNDGTQDPGRIQFMDTSNVFPVQKAPPKKAGCPCGRRYPQVRRQLGQSNPTCEEYRAVSRGYHESRRSFSTSCTMYISPASYPSQTVGFLSPLIDHPTEEPHSLFLLPKVVHDPQERDNQANEIQRSLEPIGRWIAVRLRASETQ